MDDPREDKHYERTLRMVVWGEKREDVYHMLSVNGVTGARADAVYAAARQELIATVHGEGRQKARQGLLLLGASALVFSIFWFGLQFIPRILLYAVFAGLGIGLWKLVDGFSTMLTSSRKEGPLDE